MKDIISRVGLSCRNIWPCQFDSRIGSRRWSLITGNTTPKTTQDHDLWYLNELLQKKRVAEWCVFWNIILTIQILGADTDRELRLTVLREHTRTWCWPSSVDGSWKQPTNWHLAQSALRNIIFLHGAKPTNWRSLHSYCFLSRLSGLQGSSGIIWLGAFINTLKIPKTLKWQKDKLSLRRTSEI